MFTAILSTIGGLFKFIGGVKSEQASIVREAIKVVGSTNSSSAEREAAVATIISSEMNSGHWLAATWRPLTMIVFLILVVFSFFGYTPPGINEPLAPMIERLFSLLEIGLMGYIPARTIEKIATQINIGSILKKFVEKKLI